MVNYYHILELEPSADISEIKRAYRLLAKRYHPDVNPEDARAAQKFQEVVLAYEILSDEKERRLHDIALMYAPSQRPAHAKPPQSSATASAQHPFKTKRNYDYVAEAARYRDWSFEVDSPRSSFRIHWRSLPRYHHKIMASLIGVSLLILYFHEYGLIALVFSLMQTLISSFWLQQSLNNSQKGTIHPSEVVLIYFLSMTPAAILMLPIVILISGFITFLQLL